MKRLRHHIGRWLLRDAPKPEFRVEDPGDGWLIKAIRKEQRLHGQRPTV